MVTEKNENIIQRWIRKNWDLSEFLRKADEEEIYLYKCRTCRLNRR